MLIILYMKCSTCILYFCNKCFFLHLYLSWFINHTEQKLMICQMFWDLNISKLEQEHKEMKSLCLSRLFFSLILPAVFSSSPVQSVHSGVCGSACGPSPAAVRREREKTWAHASSDTAELSAPDTHRTVSRGGETGELKHCTSMPSYPDWSTSAFWLTSRRLTLYITWSLELKPNARSKMWSGPRLEAVKRE